MNNNLKKLSKDVSNFTMLRQNDYIYVDKTHIIYDLIQRSRYYFLSRPRRFGKSLLISTLKELFLGNKELFNDLWITKNTDYVFQKHPVIHIDFSSIIDDESGSLHQKLTQRLIDIAKLYTIPLEFVKDESPGRVLYLIVQYFAQQGTSVVLLIDEYDDPLLRHITHQKKYEKNRETIQSFYKTVKSLDEYWHFVFITGISRFSKTSIFSGMNNLNDISLKPEAATLLGYTQEELVTYLSNYIDQLAHKLSLSTTETLAHLKTQYNGYRFTKQNLHVYNPFSILYCLHDQELSNYWFESGTPTFLIELLKQEKNRARALENIVPIDVTREGLFLFDIANLPLEILLYQTGYLTIADYNQKLDFYTLDYPNQEVSVSFKKCILTALMKTEPFTVSQKILALKKALYGNNIPLFVETIDSIIAHIPYSLHNKRESYYHSLLILITSILDIETHPEVMTAAGRIDLVLITDERIFVIECKFNQSPRKALDQIHQRSYYKKYVERNLPITLVGLTFNGDDKTLKIESMHEAYKPQLPTD